MDIIRIIARPLWSLAVCDGDVRFQRANIVCRLHPRIAVLAVRHGVADALPTEERRTEAVLLSRDLQLGAQLVALNFARGASNSRLRRGTNLTPAPPQPDSIRISLTASGNCRPWHRTGVVGDDNEPRFIRRDRRNDQPRAAVSVPPAYRF